MRRLLPILLAALCGCGPDPEPPKVIDPPATADDGAACRSNQECTGGVCYASFFGFPQGHCTTLECTADADCSGDAACITFIDDTSACFARCGEECRDGYGCKQVGDNEICAPVDLDLESIVLPADTEFTQTLDTLGADCEPTELGENRYAFEFTLSEQADSFMFVPFVASGDVMFERLDTPEGPLDAAEYRHHNTRLEDLGIPGREPFGTYGAISFDWPVLVPFAPTYQSYVVGGGTYSAEVITTDSKPCMYVVEGQAEGSQIDLDIYLVTLNGPTAAEAEESPDYAEALSRAEGHLAAAGVELGEVRFHDVDPSVSERFAIVRDLREVDLLAATGAPAGPTLDDHLAVDVFIVDSIVFDGIRALGISAGVPGPAGMHGNLSNGLVFSAPDLGFDNATVGQILAHELSHYLGLRHTTELIHGTGGDTEETLENTLGTTDPIDDTPECVNVDRLGSSCPDYENLMFPIIQALPQDTPLTVSPGQAQTLRRSPLVKAAPIGPTN